ncbi:uncharacterized protein LTR77_000736 [Saxophila tyrrhenica]|uniref:Macro domain-containing protein n=1 Tax=Saxophila tyrrhenica TaxID=1690608 RepID=A0AAV9PRR3_9PEZI|nr:hypothetical protein LTR77_000736 [Saxophila tyrrhenica]
MATTPLSQIPTLTELYRDNHLHPTDQPLFEKATSKFNDRIALIRTDITKLETDAIVNAANESLLGGGGVDGAIHRAAGSQLLDECAKLDGCDTGSAKITNAYRLPCKKVIHAVGPVYSRAKREEMHTKLLQGCYTTSLDLAAENHCKSLAFSALSTGIYGYPSQEAAEAAIGAVKGWLEADDEKARNIEKVVFCSFMEKDQKAYEELLPRFFPTAAEGKDNAAPAAGETKEAVASSKKADGESEKLPDLPDVPTQEPATAGQPEAKKVKLDHDVTDDSKGT